MVEGERVIEVVVSLPLDLSRNPARILEMPLDSFVKPGINEPRIFLKDLITLQATKSASAVYREQGRRVLSIQFSISGRLEVEVLQEARQKTGHLLKQPYLDQWLAGE
jgi:Cu/Ag efflux pump CusA